MPFISTTEKNKSGIYQWVSPFLVLSEYGIDKVSDPHFFIFGFLSNPINAFNSHPDL